MHEFNNGRSMLHHLCRQYDLILIFTHWLQSNNVHTLDLVDNDFACLTEIQYLEVENVSCYFHEQ